MTQDPDAAITGDPRERIRTELANRWRQQVWLIRFPNRSALYSVSGRSRKGRVLHGNKAVRVLQNVGIALFVIASSPVLVLLAILDDLGIQSTNSAARQGRLRARGPRDCAALDLADKVRSVDGEVWIAWSHSHQAVVHLAPEVHFKVVWQASGSDRPKLKSSPPSLTWPDHSSLQFSVAKDELEHIKKSNGRP